jgi:hypothetical protein
MMSVRKVAVCCVLLLIAAAAVRAEDVDVEGEDAEEVVEQRTYGLAGVETVRPPRMHTTANESQCVES